MKTVRDIIEDYLIEHGYEGLQYDECGCTLDEIFMCASDCSDCNPAYVFRCGKCSKYDKCDDTFGGEWLCSTVKDYCEPDYGVTHAEKEVGVV